MRNVPPKTLRGGIRTCPRPVCKPWSKWAGTSRPEFPSESSDMPRKDSRQEVSHSRVKVVVKTDRYRVAPGRLRCQNTTSGWRGLPSPKPGHREGHYWAMYAYLPLWSVRLVLRQVIHGPIPRDGMRHPRMIGRHHESRVVKARNGQRKAPIKCLSKPIDTNLSNASQTPVGIFCGIWKPSAGYSLILWISPTISWIRPSWMPYCN
jgi:hypothetical protein